MAELSLGLTLNLLLVVLCPLAFVLFSYRFGSNVFSSCSKLVVLVALLEAFGTPGYCFAVALAPSGGRYMALYGITKLPTYEPDPVT